MFVPDHYNHGIYKVEEKTDKCEGCYAYRHDEDFGYMCIAPACIKEYDYDQITKSYVKKVKKNAM